MPPVFGQKTAKKVIEEVESNLATLQTLDLTKSASFCMKSTENTASLSEALAKNTVVKTLVLRECEIVDKGVEAIAAALERNHTIEELDLQQNHITTQGVIALAGGLEKNQGVRTLNLLNQTQKVIGDEAVERLISMFEHNTTLTKIIWKVTSRRSWEVSKLITRNVSIQKAIASGGDASHLLPKGKEAPPAATAPPVAAAPPAQAPAQASAPAATDVQEAAASEPPALAKPEESDDSFWRVARYG